MMWQALSVVLLSPCLVFGEVGRFPVTTPKVLTSGYHFHHETKDPAVILREFLSSPSFPGQYGGKFSPPPELQRFFTEEDYFFGFPKSARSNFHRTQRTVNSNFRPEGRRHGSNFRQSYERHYGGGGRFGDTLDHSGHSGDGSSYTEVVPPWNRHRQGGFRQTGEGYRPYYGGPDNLEGDGLAKGYGIETVSRGPHSFSRDRRTGYERNYRLSSNKERDHPNGYFRSWSNANGKSYSNNWSSDSSFNWNSGSAPNDGRLRSRDQYNNSRRSFNNRPHGNQRSYSRSNSWTDGRPDWVDDIRKNVLDVFRGH